MFEILMTGNKKKSYKSGKFLGEVPVTGLITGPALAAAIGLTKGVAINSNEPWLKWEIDGKTVYYSKKPYRHTVQSSDLFSIDAADGTKTIVIAGKTYSVGLPEGRNPDYSVKLNSEKDAPASHNSEWNRLMYPIVGQAGWPKTSQEGPDQANYTDQDLGLYSWGVFLEAGLFAKTCG